MNQSAPKFPVEQIYRAARMYYLDDATQVDIADALGVSRPTVSRLVAEARRLGMVKVEVSNPFDVDHGQLEKDLQAATGLQAVYLAPSAAPGTLGVDLSAPTARAIAAMDLRPTDALLLSSGRTVYEVSRTPLPALPAVRVAPTVGGLAEHEPWFQTNEITRYFAQATGAVPTFLFAAALPSPAMHAALMEDPDFREVKALWNRAKGALLGIGAPTAGRASISRGIKVNDTALARSVGDVAMNFYTETGKAVTFPGSDRLMRTSVKQLKAIPHTVGIAAGIEKTVSIIGAIKAGLVKELVTDAATARSVLDRISAE